MRPVAFGRGWTGDVSPLTPALSSPGRGRMLFAVPRFSDLAHVRWARQPAGLPCPAEGVVVMGRYTKQFQEQAIKLVVQGQQPTVTARELGMPHSTLLNWLEKAGWRKPEPEGPLSEDPKVLAAQVKELRRQVKRLE